MAYKPNVPLANDKLSTSQGDLLGNFTEINTYTQVDHETFNIADQGKHKKITFTNQAAPVPTAGEVKISAAPMPGAIIPAVPAPVTGGNELYIARTDGANNFSFPFTASVQASPGWCYLPSGLIMKWGTGICQQGLVTPANYIAGVNIPVFAAVISAQVTFINAVANENWACWLHSYNTTQLFTFTSGHNKAYEYLVIGY